MKPSPETLRQACLELARRDKVLARAHREVGLPDWRASEPCFGALARMIAYQQISTKAGASIWGRVEARLPELTSRALLDQSDEALTACGLSRSKVRYLKAIAEAERCGAVVFADLPGLAPEAAHERLVTIKGVGPWTAQLFLLYCGHLDAFPPGDVGLMESYRLLSEAEDRLDAKAFTALAEDWRPWRGVAVHLLWDWINAARSGPRDPGAA